jgi:hypothetical protein
MGADEGELLSQAIVKLAGQPLTFADNGRVGLHPPVARDLGAGADQQHEEEQQAEHVAHVDHVGIDGRVEKEVEAGEGGQHASAGEGGDERVGIPSGLAGEAGGGEGEGAQQHQLSGQEHPGGVEIGSFAAV